MKFRFKIWNFIILILSIIFLVRITEVVRSLYLLLKFLKLIFVDFSVAIDQISFPLIDIYLSTILLIALPVYIYNKRSKSKILQKRIGFTTGTIIVLLIFFVFASIISVSNPDFEKNLGVTKLLPPFSSVKVLHLKKENSDSTLSQEFVTLKNEVVKQSFNNSIIFADSVQDGMPVVYFQNNKLNTIERSEVELQEGKPFVDTKIFLLGTDELGRDIFSRLVYGARVSLFVGLGAVIITLILGLLLGFFAGFSGGLIDSSLNRFTDMLLAFPVIFLIILILALFGNNLLAMIIVLGFSGWMSLFKIVRGEVIAMKNKEFFISAKMIGLSDINLLLKEVFPVITASVVVNLVFQYGNVILAEAALSYLGLGTGSNYPSWGQMIEAGQSYLTSGWWMILFPGIILFLTLFAANNLGKEINSYFNPHLKS